MRYDYNNTQPDYEMVYWKTKECETHVTIWKNTKSIQFLKLYISKIVNTMRYIISKTFAYNNCRFCKNCNTIFKNYCSTIFKIYHFCKIQSFFILSSLKSLKRHTCTALLNIYIHCDSMFYILYHRNKR